MLLYIKLLQIKQIISLFCEKLWEILKKCKKIL